jgi:dolichol kinase
VSKPAYDLAALDVAPASFAPAVPARPENAVRSLFHVASAVMALVMLRFIPHRELLVAVSASLALVAWSLETARRVHPPVNGYLMRFFSRIAHPEESYKVNSSTWYLTALLGLSLFAPLRAAELGVVVLGVADPAAGFIGRRIGRTKIRENRSLEGTLGFFAVGTAGALSILLAFHTLSLPAMFAIASVASAAGALIELATVRLDDNFTIPVTVALVAASVERLFVVA